MTDLDLCRLLSTISDIANNNTRWCLTADGGTWDADDNPAVIPPLEPDDYWVILDPLSPQQRYDLYPWVVVCEDAREKTLTSYSLISVIILVVAASTIIIVLRRLV